MDRCEKCGAPLRKKDEFCPKCGEAAAPRARTGRADAWKAAVAVICVAALVGVIVSVLSYGGLLPEKKAPAPETPAPVETRPAAASTVPRPMVNYYALRELAVPLACVAHQQYTPWLDAKTGRVSNDFASIFLCSYAGATLADTAQTYENISGEGSSLAYIRMTPRQVDKAFRSIFGEDTFSISGFAPDGINVVDKDGAYYVVAGNGPLCAVSYAGAAESAPYSPDAEYVFSLTTNYRLHGGGGPVTAQMLVRLAENPLSPYGYSIASVRYGNPYSASEYIRGKWKAEAEDGRAYRSDEFWYVFCGEQNLSRYADWDRYNTDTPSGAYALAWSPDGRAALSPTGGENFFGETATLEIRDHTSLLIRTAEHTYTLRYEPPEGSNQFVPDKEISGGFDENGFLLPESSVRYITEHEFASLIDVSPMEQNEVMGYAKSEIYARHGHLFSEQKYHDFYSQYDWYNAMPKQKVSPEDFSEVERLNLESIEGWMT